MMLTQLVLLLVGLIVGLFSGYCIYNFLTAKLERVVIWGVLSIIGVIISGWLALVYYVLLSGVNK